MVITHRTQGSTTIIGLQGRWVCGYDLRTELRNHLRRFIEAGRLDIVLDLGGVTFADSMVVGEIASTHVELRRRGGRLTLLNPDKRMSRLLSVTRLANVIEVRRSDESSARAWAGPTRNAPWGVVDRRLDPAIGPVSSALQVNSSM